MRWLIRISIVVFALLVIAAGVLVWTVRRPFPQESGELSVPGLDGPVEVVRDADGIPHVYASTAHDLFLAQGYVVAQDRFFQMDFWRHVGAGRLSELFGEGQVDTDAFLRTLGFSRVSRGDLDVLSPPATAALDAYADGVNAYLDGKAPGEISLEYALLGLQGVEGTPEPWEPVNTLTWTRMMAWDLRANLDEELDRAILSTMMPVERVEQLYPPYPDDHPVIVSAEDAVQATATGPTATVAAAALEEVAGKVAALEAVAGRRFEGIGSNSWVLSGDRTSTGMPLLANDPHLGIQMPSIWYEIGLHCAPKTNSCPYDLVGFTFPGAPGVVIGHNDHIAWGFTNEGPDSMDLYVERVDPTDPTRYEVDGAWEQMEVRTETIDVAGGDPVEVEIRSTRHGPVVSGVFGAADDLGEGGAVDVPDPHVLALRWTALEPSRIVDTILGLGTARDWAEFRVAVSYWDIAAQNVVYADVDGNIGYQATGRVPIRSRGDGRYPAPGWTSDHEWTGFIPFDELPRSFNPASGIIVTANQPVADDAYPYFIHRDAAYGYRADRIRDLLGPLDGATIEDLQAIQMDTFDGSAPFVLPRLLAIEPEDESVASLQETLSAFPDEGYRMDADSAAAAAYATVWRHLLANTFDELPEDRQAGGNGRYFEVVRLLLDAPADPWWDVVATPEGETRDDVLATTLSDAAGELTDRLGSNPDGWRWGDLHIAEFENQSLGTSGIGVIEALFNRTAPERVSGGSAIVDATGWIAPDGYRVVAVPSMRMVVDLADLSRSESIHTTGQSGHAYQRHYADMIERWTDGVAHPMRWTREQVDAATEHTLRLVPAG